MVRLNRKLKGVVNLIAAWKVATADDRQAVVFQEEAGDLWQLCDVGLGWTVFKEIGTDWTPEPTIQMHLPALVKARPETAGPWRYNLQIGPTAVIEVYPGKLPGTFRWSVVRK
jgi:hypothetical protein